MKPISPFDSAPVSAMNFPVSEYVSAFRDAGKMQMAGQQAMMEGINKGVSSVTDYLEESRKSQAQANAFKPFFNKATLQNLMGISGDESAAVIEQFKNASTDEKIALGKVLTGTLVEAELKRKALELEKDRARAEMIIRSGYIPPSQSYQAPSGSVDVGGAQPVTAEGALPEESINASANAMTSGSPLEGALPEGGGAQGVGIPLIPGTITESKTNIGITPAKSNTLAGEAENIVTAQANAAAAQAKADARQKLEIEQDIKGIQTARKTITDPDPGEEFDKKQEIDQLKKNKLDEKLALLERQGKKIQAEQVKHDINTLNTKLDKSYFDEDNVKEAKNYYWSNKNQTIRANMNTLQSHINTAKKQYDSGNIAAAIATIQSSVAPALNSLSSPNALGELERESTTPELTSILRNKGAIERFMNKAREFVAGAQNSSTLASKLAGADVAGYLNRTEQISRDFADTYNSTIFKEITSQIGEKYLPKLKGVRPIELPIYAYKNVGAPDSIPGVNQGGGTKTNTPWRMTTSGITPAGASGGAQENKPKIPFSQMTGY